ncbi:MAG TPA: hypothetical protein VF069_27515 [Streptosporangiaceae bacterium]
MQAQVFNVTPVAYGTYAREGDTDPAKWRDGTLVEYVDVLDNEGTTRRMTLRQGMNGERAGTGTVCDMDVLVVAKQFVTYRRDGREQVRTRESYRVMEMRPVVAPAEHETAKKGS